MRGLAVGVVIVAILSAPAAWAREARSRGAPRQSLEAMVEAEWAAQEAARGRAPESAEAIRDALDRAGRLLADLRTMPHAPDLAPEAAALGRLRTQADGLDALDAAARLALYKAVRAAGREAALKNPLFADTPLVFMKRRRFICQMLHEYVAYFDDYGGVLGGGVCVLEKPGRSLEVRDLISGRLPPGCFTTLALSYDAKRIYFAQAECTGRPVPLGAPKQAFYHVFDVDPAGAELRQLTDGRHDDFDPCPLPDGGIAFMSTRRGGFTRCNNPWEPIPVYTLHRMDADGDHVRTLSFHETNEWHPSVLGDGRIVYTRWDYVDRSAAHFHGLWVTNPDGSNPAALFGNYTGRINACFQPHAIPGSQRILFVAGAHHANVGGSLVLLDPSRVRLDPEHGTDRFDAIEVLTPEVCFPEGDGADGGWPKTYYHSPWPLSEKYFLVSFGRGPLPGMSSGGKEDTTGLYYLDRFGNLELLYRDDRCASMYPIPLAPRPKPPVVPSTLSAGMGEEGEFVLTDVRRSLLPLPEGRPIQAIRIFQVLPKTTPTANEPRLGHANAEGARVLVGTVPVEADGSAYFRAPARKPLYFQAIDESGRAVQSMRSVTYLQPGERRGCVGCHEPSDTAAAPRSTLATRRPASTIRPGPDGTRPFGYPRLVQPVLDRHCTRCHDGTEGAGKSPLVLTGEPTDAFTRSYEALRPYLRWYEWGGESLAGTVTQPGHVGATESRLRAVLADATHADAVQLADEDRERLAVWLDGNVPFYGTYEAKAREAQKRGEAVPVPEVQ